MFNGLAQPGDPPLVKGDVVLDILHLLRAQGGKLSYCLMRHRENDRCISSKARVLAYSLLNLAWDTSTEAWKEKAVSSCENDTILAEFPVPVDKTTRPA